MASGDSSLPNEAGMIDAHFPLKGPCFCCGEQDGRHRLLDAIKGRHGAGDSVELLANDYGRPVAAICAVLGFRRAGDA